MSKPPPPGIYVPAVLFFKEDEELDYEAIQKHILRLAQVVTFDIYTPALKTAISFRDLSLGSLSKDQTERHSISRTRSANVPSVSHEPRSMNHGFQHVLVIAGTGAQSTRETKQLNFDAKEAGATHALVLTPSTWKSAMNKELILRFHREVRGAGSNCVALTVTH